MVSVLVFVIYANIKLAGNYSLQNFKLLIVAPFHRSQLRKHNKDSIRFSYMTFENVCYKLIVQQIGSIYEGIVTKIGVTRAKCVNNTTQIKLEDSKYLVKIKKTSGANFIKHVEPSLLEHASNVVMAQFVCLHTWDIASRIAQQKKQVKSQKY